MSDSRLQAKSGSVWYEQVDTALVSLLSNIQVQNSEGELEPVKVVIKSPDTEIKEFPCISIFCYDERFDNNRFGGEKFVINRDMNKGTATIEYPALPFNLYYQIELWAEYHLDINSMAMQFLNLIGEHYSLSVKDTEGNSRLSVMDKVDYKNLDYVDDDLKKKVFRRLYSYRIQVELDEKLPYTIPMASDINLKF